ncbi:MAG: RsmG family class I SAM-dependent methyltransferase [Balneolaceae bacterium]
MDFQRQTVSRETLNKARKLYARYGEKLDHYLDQLMWWNERVNLVSRDVSRETVREHLVHSLIPAVMDLLHQKQWVDTGTGGGLPGIPLSIVEPEKEWILNDVVKKKIAAIRQMVYRLSIDNVQTDDGSIESLSLPDGCGIISKHAFDLNDLLKMTDGAERWERVILFKGVTDAEEELKSVPDRFQATLLSFDFGDDELFYKQKGLVIIEPGVCRT